jgi:hypothetical protein
MLTWCDAEIANRDKGQVLEACTVGDRCEIKGIIMGHGAFGWVKITSVRSLTQEKSGGRVKLEDDVDLLGMKWSRLSEQLFRVAKWNLCRG